jgi:hypothetical protein
MNGVPATDLLLWTYIQDPAGGSAAGSSYETAAAATSTRVSYLAMRSSGTLSTSRTRGKSRGVVPVHSASTLGAATPSIRSSSLTVRKSMLKRVRLVVFGTVE